MQTALLTTKLYIPPSCKTLVERPGWLSLAGVDWVEPSTRDLLLTCPETCTI
jgi:uncharacterized protein (DUF1684 family)